mmetsp:Transcript_78700/g.218625  ORF Transcript_78700/g.218625 Transcript_78700/m.218625 type:complete len:406 (+) Transcript_78700:1-1218(+)
MVCSARRPGHCCACCRASRLDIARGQVRQRPAHLDGAKATTRIANDMRRLPGQNRTRRLRSRPHRLVAPLAFQSDAPNTANAAEVACKPTTAGGWRLGAGRQRSGASRGGSVEGTSATPRSAAFWRRGRAPNARKARQKRLHIRPSTATFVVLKAQWRRKHASAVLRHHERSPVSVRFACRPRAVTDCSLRTLLRQQHHGLHGRLVQVLPHVLLILLVGVRGSEQRGADDDPKEERELVGHSTAADEMNEHRHEEGAKSLRNVVEHGIHRHQRAPSLGQVHVQEHSACARRRHCRHKAARHQDYEEGALGCLLQGPKHAAPAEDDKERKRADDVTHTREHHQMPLVALVKCLADETAHDDAGESGDGHEGDRAECIVPGHADVLHKKVMEVDDDHTPWDVARERL